LYQAQAYPVCILNRIATYFSLSADLFSASAFQFLTSKGFPMKYSIIISALFAVLTLTACDEKPPTVVNVPAPAAPVIVPANDTVVVPVPVPVPVPGPAGATGKTGDTGDQGKTGKSGTQGEAGTSGEQGNQGETGAQGVEGDKGDTGASGDTTVIVTPPATPEN
jgi:hypothetical protein